MAITTGKYRTRKLDSNGDPVISGTVWLYDIDAIAQTIQTRLNLFSGEFWRDVTEGTPWIGSILGKNNAQKTVQAKASILKSRILDTDGVLSILEWENDFDYSDRKFTVTATVLTEYGALSLDEDLSDNEVTQDSDVASLVEAVARYNYNSTKFNAELFQP